MNYESFFTGLKGRSVLIASPQMDPAENHLLSNEALFQLPLISMIILMLAKDRRKPRVEEIGQLVGECIEQTLIVFKGSSQHVGWSANLRVRTVKALSFLENSRLVAVEERKGRLAASELGKKVIARALANEDELSACLSHVARSYRNICVSRQLDLELE